MSLDLLPLLLQKYRQKNPYRRVLTASFLKERKVMEVKVWYSLKEIKDRDASLPHFIHHGKDIPFQLCELYLYDGPPDMVPMGNTRMVAFSYHNSGWFETMRKGQHRVRLYMPMSTPLSELKEAVYVLGLEVSPEQLLGRIELFGGTGGQGSHRCHFGQDRIVGLRVKVLRGKGGLGECRPSPNALRQGRCRLEG